MNDKPFKKCNFQTFNKWNDECSLRSFKNKIKWSTTETNDKMSKDNLMGYNQ